MSRALLLACGCFPLLVLGSESEIQLHDGPGKELVLSRCTVCHSLDYLQMNSPLLDNSGWEKELEKMIKVMGASVSAEEKPVILKYLNDHYGK